MADEKINTEGGGVVKGDVDTKGGDFAGRNKITTTSHTERTETTFTTNLSGNAIVAIVAIFMLGIITAFVVFRDKRLELPISQSVGVVSTIPNQEKQAASISTSTPEHTQTLAEPTPTPLKASLAPPTNPITGTIWVSSKYGVTFVYVPAGEFMMGSTEEQISTINSQSAHKFDISHESSTHTVFIDNFWIMQTEVTNAQYKYCVEKRRCEPPKNIVWNNLAYANHPVTNITWNQAKTYAEWIDGRLPTEAEWEKACRGTDGRIYPWGNQAPNPQLLNYGESNEISKTTQVSSYPSGTYNLYDMAGNVWEWTADWYDARYYKHSPTANPQNSIISVYRRVVRGGAFHDGAVDIRCAERSADNPDAESDDRGFRVVSRQLTH